MPCRAATLFCEQERKEKLTELRILAPFPALLGKLALASQHKDLEQEGNLLLPSFSPQQRPTCSSMAWRWVRAGWTWVNTVSRPLQRQLQLLLHPRTTELGRYSALSTEILGYGLVFCFDFYPCQVQFPSLSLSSFLSSVSLILLKDFPFGRMPRCLLIFSKVLSLQNDRSSFCRNTLYSGILIAMALFESPSPEGFKRCVDMALEDTVSCGLAATVKSAHGFSSCMALLCGVLVQKVCLHLSALYSF